MHRSPETKILGRPLVVRGVSDGGGPGRTAAGLVETMIETHARTHLSAGAAARSDAVTTGGGRRLPQQQQQQQLIDVHPSVSVGARYVTYDVTGTWEEARRRLPRQKLAARPGRRLRTTRGRCAELAKFSSASRPQILFPHRGHKN